MPRKEQRMDRFTSDEHYYDLVRSMYRQGYTFTARSRVSVTPDKCREIVVHDAPRKEGGTLDG